MSSLKHCRRKPQYDGCSQLGKQSTVSDDLSQQPATKTGTGFVVVQRGEGFNTHTAALTVRRVQLHTRTNTHTVMAFCLFVSLLNV